MHDRNFRRSVFLAIAMIIIESLLLFGKSFSQRAPSVDNNSEQMTISKVLGSAELQAALKRCKGQSLIISFYPVRSMDGKREKRWDFKVVYQCKEERVSKGAATKINKSFSENTRTYIKYLRKMQVPKENVPFCYYIELTPKEANDIVGLAVSLDPLKSDFKAATIFPCGVNGGGDSADCSGGHPVYLAYSVIPPGKCPPNCPRILQQSTYTNDVRKAVDTIYSKE